MVVKPCTCCSGDRRLRRSEGPFCRFTLSWFCCRFPLLTEEFWILKVFVLICVKEPRIDDSSLSHSLYNLLCLYSGRANEFLYTRQGRSPVIDGVDDTKELSTTRQAFALLGNMRLAL